MGNNFGACCDAADEKDSLQHVTANPDMPTYQDEYSKQDGENGRGMIALPPADKLSTTAPGKPQVEQEAPYAPEPAPTPEPAPAPTVHVTPPPTIQEEARKPSAQPPPEHQQPMNPIVEEMTEKGFDIFHVELRMTPGKKLGMGVGYKEGEPYPLRVTRILADGLVGGWNDTHPGKEVEVGHHILELNGKPAAELEPDQVQKLVAGSEMLKLIVLRNGPADIIPTD